jgi:hypothetical protein
MIEVEDYSRKRLCEIIYKANEERTSFEKIQNGDYHIKYLDRYFQRSKGLSAKFIYVEKNYVSIDYLTDFSFYYSKSYDSYSSKCTRIHFFASDTQDKIKFQNALTAQLLQKDTDEFWNESYLGFIVIRPIPVFYLGYSILRHYNYTKLNGVYDEQRCYWGVKDYTVNFLGRNVKIESLAFLSQDTNVGACATVSIWCMLQRAVENYYINLKSPYEITIDAGLTLSTGRRLIPNMGLDPLSICHIITKSNLATEVVDFYEKSHNTISNDVIREYVYAYSNIRLPIILGVEVPEGGIMYGHAVAICGHSTKKKKTNELRFSFGKDSDSSPLKLKAMEISKLFVHDDQWGPFARVDFVGKRFLKTPWTKHTDEKKNSRPIVLVVSVFQKIRISYNDIRIRANLLNEFMDFCFGGDFVNRIVWSVQIQYSSTFKATLRGLGPLLNDVDKSRILRFLALALPKFIWVITMSVDGRDALHFIYDATGLRNTGIFIGALAPGASLLTDIVKVIDEVKNDQGETSMEYLKLITGQDGFESFYSGLKKFD